ncbi:myb-related transcription factor, partner of profilin-like isoform X2 [Rana temporaria]|uniref:myb-related transcription factor, partner of profilin-like isoform X2 n=1 Tax=Rana temporaria TaxID=8407 RepID=UPI001AAD163C|nr:myb-related transcription factor, partner of profilin-like isoform X2 [Rana temporaria]XP_040210463.1 myb-related transcription factor, partner of profilin-like isoform X2 [Rana temporaria]
MEGLKKKRVAKFTYTQNCVLVSRVVNNWDRLYGQRSQMLSQSKKDAIWSSIVEQVNASGDIARTISSCKRRMVDIKNLLKKKMTAVAKHQRGTGGGPPVDVNFTIYEEELKGCLGPDTILGVPGEYDSDTHMLQEPLNEEETANDHEVQPVQEGDHTLMLFTDDDSTQILVEYEVMEDSNLCAPEEVQNEEDPQPGPSHPDQLENVTHNNDGAVDAVPLTNQEEERVEVAPAINSSSGPIRVPRGRRRRQLIADRVEAAGNASVQLEQTLHSLREGLRDRQTTQDSILTSIVGEMRRSNENMERLTTAVLQQQIIFKEMLEEHKKMSLALMHLVGHMTLPPQQLARMDD